MKYLIYIFTIAAVSLTSCVQDPWDDVEESGWNNERSVLDIQFENQVGTADIERVDAETGNIEFTINPYAVEDFSAVKIMSLTLSYGGTSSVAEGETLNFDNESNSATIVVTSPTGKSREYTITVDPFEETLLGTYDITDLVVYGGTGPEYGGASVIPMMNKPWVWDGTDGPSAELDNTLTFEFGGFTEDGNTYGTVINDAGDDGLYADFIVVNSDPETDVNEFYRKIPKGEGEWERNYTTGNIIFTFSDGSTATGTLIGSGTEDMGYGKSKTTTDQAFAFNLQGTDDWDNIYSDYDKFARRPRRYWIDVTKL